MTSSLPFPRLMDRTNLGAILLFVVVSGTALRPLPLEMTSSIPAGSDPPHHLYILNWLLDHAFTPERFEGAMFHPAKHAVLRSDLSLGTVLLVAPLAKVLDEPLVRFNVATWIALTFSGFAFFLLARDVTDSVTGGLLCGVTSVMGSHAALHFGHLNLLSVGWLPIFLLALNRLVVASSSRRAVGTGIAFALNALSSGYYAVAALIVGAAVFAFRASRKALAFCGIAALIAGVLVAPYASAYFDMRHEEDLERTDVEVLKGSLGLQDWGSKTLAHRGWNPAFGEPLFPGVVVTVLSLIGARQAIREREPFMLALIVATLTLVWLALGPRFLLYTTVASIPPFGSMRHPVTLAAVAMMLLTVAAARGLATVSARRRGTAFALVGVAWFESLGPPISTQPVLPGVPLIYEALLSLPRGPILDGAPLDHEPLVWAARRHFETVNGGGAFIPKLTLRIHTNVSNHWIRDSFEPIDESKAARALLNETGVRYVIVPAGRIGSLKPLVQRMRESRCFRPVAEAQGDIAFEAQRTAECPAFGG